MAPLSAADASAGRILEVLDAEPGVQDHPTATTPASIAGRVAFENVCFSYDGEDCQEAVLTDISFVAEPGERVALLGGRLSLQNQANAGLRLEVEIPHPRVADNIMD